MDAVMISKFDRYFICSDGEIFSTRSNKWLGGGLGTNGRPMVILVLGAGETRIFYRQNLVAETFIGPRPKGLEVSHQDGNILNNDVSNLKYETHAKNLSHRREHGTMDDGFNNSRASLTKEMVNQIFKDREDGLTHQAIADKIGVSRTTVSRVLNRQRYVG